MGMGVKNHTNPLFCDKFRYRSANTLIIAKSGQNMQGNGSILENVNKM
jgi:hypothetical protein